MSSFLRLPITIGLLAIIGGLVVPWLLSVRTLLGLNRDWTPDDRYAGLAKTCKVLHADKFIGCEKFTIVDNELFAACITDWSQRQKFFPPMAAFNEDVGPQGAIQGKIWKMNLDVSFDLTIRKGIYNCTRKTYDLRSNDKEKNRS